MIFCPAFSASIILAIQSRPAHAEDSGPAGNGLLNPSFEQAEGDGVSGWKSEALSPGQDVRWFVEPFGMTGARCVSIRREKGAGAAWTATATVTPNTFYRLSGWIKTRDVHGDMGALLGIRNGAICGTAAVSCTKHWTQVIAVFRARKDTRVEVNCLFGDQRTATGQAWHDDIVLEKANGRPANPEMAAKMAAACPAAKPSPRSATSAVHSDLPDLAARNEE